MLAFLRGLGCALVLSVSACAQHVYSPPARGMPRESSRALAPEESALMLEAGGSGAVFGPDFLASAVRFRHGLSAQLEGSAELGLLRVTSEGETTSHRNAYAARVAAKYALVKWVALIGGLGGGGSAGGAFVSPDVGVLVSGENRYIVPTLSLRSFVSQPIASARVDLGLDENEDEGRAYGEPRFTYGFALSSSLRVPMWACDALTHSLYAGFTMTHLADTTQSLSVLGVSAGFELVF